MTRHNKAVPKKAVLERKKNRFRRTDESRTKTHANLSFEKLVVVWNLCLRDYEFKRETSNRDSRFEETRAKQRDKKNEFSDQNQPSYLFIIDYNQRLLEATDSSHRLRKRKE